MTMLHALFHSGSFLAYMLVIYGLQALLFIPFDWFDLPEDLVDGILALVSFVVVAFIWWTYRSKIKEDHSDKTDDSCSVERRDMRFFVDLVRAVFGERARGAAVAGSVAVDMLAISALLRTALLPGPTGVVQSSWTGFLILDLVIFAALIAMAVSVSVFLAQQFGASLREISPKIAAVLRVAEPFAVFFIMAGLIRTTAQYNGFVMQVEWPVDANLIDAIFAGFVVVSLFWSNSISWTKLVEIASRRNADDVSQTTVVTRATVMSDLKKLEPAVGVALLVGLVVFSGLLVAYLTPGEIGHNHLVEGTGYIAALCLFVTGVILYWPSVVLDSWETNTSSNFRSFQTATPMHFWNRLVGVALALLALNAYSIFLFDLNFQTEASLVWSGYLLLTWALFDARRWRFCISDLGGEARRANDADYAELLSAFGLASSAVAIIAPVLTRSLS
tara:strand:- start:12403 stop:13740 length:1338 start_codon:yes stop_codon:yes gene_type:complete